MKGKTLSEIKQDVLAELSRRQPRIKQQLMSLEEEIDELEEYPEI